jgi:hypothetical protein
MVASSMPTKEIETGAAISLAAIADALAQIHEGDLSTSLDFLSAQAASSD